MQLFEAFALLNLAREIFGLSWRPPLTLGLLGLNAAAFFAKGRVLPLLGPWTVSSCGFDGQRAYLLVRVLAVAARGGSRGCVGVVHGALGWPCSRCVSSCGAYWPRSCCTSTHGTSTTT